MQNLVIPEGKKAIYKNRGVEVNLIRNQSDIDFIKLSKGCWGYEPQIGYYSLWLGISDGGYLIISPDEVEIVDR